MTQVDTARFRQTEKYAAYLDTTEGRLRLDLGWVNLRQFLPAPGTSGRALDVGCGTGHFALRLAELGFAVHMLDNSAPMLEVAREQARSRGVSSRSSLHDGEADCLDNLFDPSSFDVVVCHNLLEYVAEPLTVLRGIAYLLKKDSKSFASVMVRNRNGEVLKAAIKLRDSALAQETLVAETVLDSLYGEPVRVFDPGELRSEMESAGLQVIAERGVRVISDYVAPKDVTGEDYKRLQDLELLLGAQPQFAAVARYTQLIARPSAISSGSHH